MSADGSVIVGYSQSDFGAEAFRWTESEGMVGLGDLPGGEFYSQALGTADLSQSMANDDTQMGRKGSRNG